MKLETTDNIELSYLGLQDYKPLKAAMKATYHFMSDAYWTKKEIKALVKRFPQGQMVIKVNGEFAGFILSMIVNYDDFSDDHTYEEATGDYTFNTHDKNGDTLYGIDILVLSKFRKLGLGQRLYDYRKELCRKLNLKSIIFGGRIPNYHKHSDMLSPKEYVEKVQQKEIYDPVLNFQLSNGFRPLDVIAGFLEEDIESKEFAVLLKWENPDYEDKALFF